MSHQLNLKWFPVELIETILVFVGDDSHFPSMMVCRKWFWILREWRLRNKRTLILKTPYYIGLQTPTMYEWAIVNNYILAIHKESEIAGKHGSFETLQHLHTNRFINGRSASYGAALGGHLHIMKWINAHGYLIDGDKCSETAAQLGHLSIVQWLRTHNKFSYLRVYASAALGGHLEILKWLKAQGLFFDRYTVQNAVRSGNLELLIWIQANGGAIPSELILLAASSNHINIFKWIYEQTGSMPDVAFVYAHATRNNNVEMVQWMLDKHYKPHFSNISSAATFGRLEILKLFYQHGEQMDGSVFLGAIQHNHLSLLKWAIEINVELPLNTCFVAARQKHYDILKWACDNGCPCHYNVFMELEKDNEFGIIKWLLNHGYHQ
jgi:hypothetical protein